MTGQTVILRANRETAHRIVDVAPPGSVMTVSKPRRTVDQNAKLHAMISDVARAKPEGRDYPVEVWKPLFMAMCGHKVRFEPALDGNGVVPIGFRTSRLDKEQCAELIDAVDAYAAEHGIELQEPKE